jgi:hypothetical protein
VGVVDQTIQDGIGQVRIADPGRPFVYRELSGHQGSAAAVSVFEDKRQRNVYPGQLAVFLYKILH